MAVLKDISQSNISQIIAPPILDTGQQLVAFEVDADDPTNLKVRTAALASDSTEGTVENKQVIPNLAAQLMDGPELLNNETPNSFDIRIYNTSERFTVNNGSFFLELRGVPDNSWQTGLASASDLAKVSHSNVAVTGFPAGVNASVTKVTASTYDEKGFKGSTRRERRSWNQAKLEKYEIWSMLDQNNNSAWFKIGISNSKNVVALGAFKNNEAHYFNINVNNVITNLVSGDQGAIVRIHPHNLTGEDTANGNAPMKYLDAQHGRRIFATIQFRRTMLVERGKKICIGANASVLESALYVKGQTFFESGNSIGLFIDRYGHVGIGTASVPTKLYVKGPATIESTSQKSLSIKNPDTTKGNDGAAEIHFECTYSKGVATLGYSNIPNRGFFISTGGLDRVNISSDGKMSIGTKKQLPFTEPNAQLAIQADYNNKSAILENFYGNGLTVDENGKVSIYADNAGAPGAQLYVTADKNNKEKVAIFQNHNGNGLTVDENGKVSIYADNAEAPGAQLNVKADSGNPAANLFAQNGKGLIVDVNGNVEVTGTKIQLGDVEILGKLTIGNWVLALDGAGSLQISNETSFSHNAVGGQKLMIKYGSSAAQEAIRNNDPCRIINDAYSGKNRFLYCEKSSSDTEADAYFCYDDNGDYTKYANFKFLKYHYD
ncbi:MAG: hypothetical protein AAFZ15_23100 [Bacteroidota bacterium]